VVRIDPAGKGVHLPLELLEERRILALQAAEGIGGPGRGLPCLDAELLRQREQGCVLAVERLAAGVEGGIPDRNAPRSSADSVPGFEDEDVYPLTVEAVRSRESREARPDDDDPSALAHSRSSRTSPKSTPSIQAS
jgi:hypothetical protein